jgi:hypothetical protein
VNATDDDALIAPMPQKVWQAYVSDPWFDAGLAYLGMFSTEERALDVARRAAESGKFRCRPDAYGADEWTLDEETVRN